MVLNEIDLFKVKFVFNTIIDRLIDKSGKGNIPIDDKLRLYWDANLEDRYNMESNPGELGVGSLADDMSFIQQTFDLIKNGADLPEYSLIHVAPIVRYLAERVVL